jgi:two-component system chemotaxis response regulator CheY
MDMTEEKPKLRAVIVEDDAASRAMLRGILQNMNVEVAGEATNGRRGIQLSAEKTPDLVCLDIGLPDIDGGKVLEEMLASNPESRVVMVTGSSQREKVRECLAGGAVGYIVKPYAASTVRSTLKRLFPDHAVQ